MLFSRFSLLLLSAASFSSVISQGLTGTSEVAPIAGLFDLEKRAPIPAPPRHHHHHHHRKLKKKVQHHRRPTPHRKPKHRKPKHRRPSHRPSHGHGHGHHSHGHGHHHHPSHGHGHGHHHGHGGHGHGHGHGHGGHHGGHGGHHSRACKPSKCHQLIPNHAHHICSRNECSFACNDGFRFNGKKCIPGPSACKASKCRNRLPPHAYRVCRAGHCDFSCKAGYHRDGNSCKFGLDLRRDPQNCGAVGNVCPSDYLGAGTPQCVNSRCKLRCPAGSTFHAGPPATCS